MKKLVLLAVAGIAFIGVLAVAAVLLSTGGSMPFSLSASSPTPGAPAAAPAAPSGDAPAPAVSKVPGQPPGPRQIRPNPRVVKAELTDPLRPCFDRFPPASRSLAVLVLDLEGTQDGVASVAGSRVKSWGEASAGLVGCVQETLRGRKVPGGTLPPGEHAEFEYALEIPAAIVPPAPEPPPVTLPTNRQPPPRRSGGGR